MSYSILLVLYYSVQMDILHASEYIGLHEGIGLFELCDKLLGFKSLAGGSAIYMTGAACIGKMARALQEVKVVVVSPGTDISLSYQI